MRNVAIGLLVAAAVVAVTAGGCGKKVTSRQAVEFNDALVAQNRRLVAAGDEFVERATRALQGGGSVDVAMARRSYESAMETMDRVRSDVRIVQVPDSEAARKYYVEFQRSLENQDRMIRRDLAAIVRVIEDATLAPQARHARIVGIASRLEESAKRDFAELRAAQAEFAAAHGFTLR